MSNHDKKRKHNLEDSESNVIALHDPLEDDPLPGAMSSPSNNNKHRDNQLDGPQTIQSTAMSDAARFNSSIFRKLQKALEKDPEVDLLSLFPTKYSARLGARKVTLEKKTEPTLSDVTAKNEEEMGAFQPVPLPTTPARIAFPLSPRVRTFLALEEETQNVSDSDLTAALREALKNIELLWQTRFCPGHYVAKCASGIVVKVSPLFDDLTEYETLQYLEQHAPHFPVPRPHGVIVSGKTAYIFMTLMPGTTLKQVWSEMAETQKISVSKQLNKLFQELRTLPHSDSMSLGGVGGQGCKDTRRVTRVSPSPISNIVEFREFQLSSARCNSRIYYEFLHKLTLSIPSVDIVFTHGDVRTENIMVERNANGDYFVSGIVDWEMSGFYPEDFECTKTTNTLATHEEDDWFLYLPECISPTKFPLRWFCDRLWYDHIH